VNRVINELVKLGAEVVDENEHDVHVSGHACQEELKIMLNTVKPKYFIPVHGEYRHLYAHAKLAKTLGYTSDNIFLMDIGKVLELDDQSCRINGNVQAGRVFVDGLGVGDVGNIVLRDRVHLAQDGLIVIVATLDQEGNILAGPDVVSRGFVYVRESGS
jgi:ribonuclease J